MTSATMLLLLLASLSMIAAVHAELTRPPRSRRMAALPIGCPRSASECDRLYSTPPIATCARGAVRL